MKAQLYILLYAFLCLITTVSCSDDDKSTPSFKVSTTEINFNTSGGSEILHIVPVGQWNISSSVDWCKVTPSSGIGNETTKIEIVVDKNTTNEVRTGVLTVTSGGFSEQITINQASKDLLLIKKEQYEITSQAQNIVVEFQVNNKYAINIKNTWIAESASRSVSDVYKTFVIEANTSSMVWEGKIEITLGILLKLLQLYKLEIV